MPRCPSCSPGHGRSTLFSLWNHVSSHAVIGPQNKEPPCLPLLIWCYHIVGNMDHKGSIKRLIWGQPTIYCHIICFWKRDYKSCPHPSSLAQHIKLDEILTSKLQHSLFSFFSVPEALKWIKLFQTVFWGSLIRPHAFMWVFPNAATWCHSLCPWRGISVIAGNLGPCLSVSQHKFNLAGASAQQLEPDKR